MTVKGMHTGDSFDVQTLLNASAWRTKFGENGNTWMQVCVN